MESLLSLKRITLIVKNNKSGTSQEENEGNLKIKSPFIQKKIKGTKNIWLPFDGFPMQQLHMLVRW
jgi:hypothetical protein